MSRRSFAGILLLVALAAGIARAEVLTLKDGRVLHGEIVAHSERGFTVMRYDNLGKVSLKWDMLRPEDKKRLRVRYHYEEEETTSDLVMIGHRIYPKQSDYKDCLVEKEDQTFLYVRAGGVVNPYRKDALRKPAEEREVSVFEVYSAEQLYEKKLAEMKGLENDVRALYEFARYCTRVTMYDKAVENFMKVKELDPEFMAEAVALHLKKAETLDQDKVTRALMKEADQKGYAKSFDECLTIYGDIVKSPTVNAEVKTQAQKNLAVWKKKREDYFRGEVKRGYLATAYRKIEEIARDKRILSQDPKEQLTIDKAMAMVRSELHKQVVEALAAKYKLDPKKEVEKFWKERVRSTNGPVTYSTGTFIVAGVKDANQSGGQQDEIGKQVNDLLRRFGNRRGQQQEQQQAEPPPELISKEKWWTTMPSSMRAYWLRAYFVENSGQFEIVRRQIQPCESCGGKGSQQQFGAQGAATRVTCPRCQGNKGDSQLWFK